MIGLIALYTRAHFHPMHMNVFFCLFLSIDYRIDISDRKIDQEVQNRFCTVAEEISFFTGE